MCGESVTGEALEGAGIQKHEHMLTSTDTRAYARLGPDIYKHTGTRVCVCIYIEHGKNSANVVRQQAIP